MTTTIVKDRLQEIQKKDLLEGKHSPDGPMCVMEAVAYVAGEPWSDHPSCACPVLTSFCMTWNDNLPHDARQMLKPYVPKLVGTRSSKVVERERADMACEWLVRIFTPAWLDLAGLHDEANALWVLPHLHGMTAAQIADRYVPVINVAKKKAGAAWDAAGAAWDAAWVAARDAARGAAGDAAGAAWDTAWDAAGDAAGAAWDTAWDTAWDAARGAARAAAWVAARGAAGDAAWGAARDALAPTVLALQISALELLDRMIAVGK